VVRYSSDLACGPFFSLCLWSEGVDWLTGCEQFAYKGAGTMFNCPHCEKPGISKLRKAVLSPGLHATCKTCGGVSGIRYLPWLSAMIPGSMLMLIALLVTTESLEWTLNIVGFMLMIAIPFLLTPLRKESLHAPQSEK